MSQDTAHPTMRAHKGNAPSLPQTKYCSLCPAKFTRTTHLNRHLRTHTNERLHRCNLCKSSEFTRSDLLTRHKRTCGQSANRSRRKSCEACAESKIKCNLQYPCSKCTSRGRKCVFQNDPAEARMKKRSKGSESAAASSPESPPAEGCPRSLTPPFPSPPRNRSPASDECSMTRRSSCSSTSSSSLSPLPALAECDSGTSSSSSESSSSQSPRSQTFDEPYNNPYDFEFDFDFPFDVDTVYEPPLGPPQFNEHSLFPCQSPSLLYSAAQTQEWESSGFVKESKSIVSTPGSRTLAGDQDPFALVMPHNQHDYLDACAVAPFLDPYRASQLAALLNLLNAWL
ncbi:hypothetical protein B0H11DRAFT_2110335 [Mycena galericulata]|nr:hypothetical protein B0H11DRAFT_2110335 [Mycena galericulata]